MNKEREEAESLVSWAAQVLACPQCHAPLSSRDNEVTCARCGCVGRIDQGILRVGVREEDPSIQWYRQKGGAFFHERSQVAYTMSSLDTPVYHGYLSAMRPSSTDAFIVDVGAGDGRNTSPWLEWGYQRIIATDAVAASLARFQQRLQSEHPKWLDRVLLIECDARRLPLATESVDVAMAIEALCYLNQDYPQGLSDCARILKKAGRLLLSERTWEGAALTRLLYGGVPDMVKMHHSHDMWDGEGKNAVRSRCFTEAELVDLVRQQSLVPLECKGVSLLSVVLGYLRGGGKLAAGDQELLPQVQVMLQDLGKQGFVRRTHVVVAEKPGAT